VSRQLFGTDGIRGVANEYPLDDAGCKQIGKAIGVHFGKPGQSILVGYDPRESSPRICENVSDGLISVGVNVVIVGVIPTPGLAFLTKNGNFSAGVMITASHNPYTDNGIKVFGPNGDKLPDDAEEELNSLIESTIQKVDSGKLSTDLQLIKTYENYLVDSAGGYLLKDLDLAIDCANGATSGIAERVFIKLGAKVTTICDSPNGTNINVECGATDTKTLQELVVDKQLMAGLAFDGDGDRLIAVDTQGRQLDGDNVMYLLAVGNSFSGVVATVMSNLGFENALKNLGIDLQKTAVGDRYVLEGLEKTGYSLGGEQSGHIILTEYSGTGDGILAGIHTLIAVLKSGKTLSDWRDELKLLPQALINIPLSDKSLLDKPKINEYIATQTADLGDSGRLLIRPSGTEPKARIMVESEDAETRSKIIAVKLQQLIKEASV
jgi:phosphoglucosamine mutase